MLSSSHYCVDILIRIYCASAMVVDPSIPSHLPLCTLVTLCSLPIHMLTASGERPKGYDLLIDLSSKITTYQMLPSPMIRLLVRLFVVVQTRTPRQS